MKKFIKYTAILGLVLSVLGFGVAWAASLSGGRWYRDMDRYEITIRPEAIWPEDHMGGDHHDGEDGDVIERWIEEKLPKKPLQWEAEWIDGDTAAFPVKEGLKLAIVRGDVTLVTGDVEKIQIVCDGLEDKKGQWIGASMKKNCLELTIDGEDNAVPDLTITVPSDTRFQDVEIDMAAGSCTLADLRAQDLEVDLAAGLLEVQRGEVMDLDLQCGAGNIGYTGRVTGDVDADCAAGMIGLQLYGDEKAFNYHLEGAGGAIAVGELELGGLLFKKEIDNDAAKDMDLQCAAGSIQVHFLGEDL